MFRPWQAGDWIDCQYFVRYGKRECIAQSRNVVVDCLAAQIWTVCDGGQNVNWLRVSSVIGRSMV
jgi:hypothetical protein